VSTRSAPLSSLAVVRSPVSATPPLTSTATRRYLFTQILGGWLATKFGGKWVFGVGVLGTAVLTIITPIVVKQCPLWVFIVVRILEGVGEGVTFPAMHGVWARWAPPMERSKLATMSYSGAYVGTIVSMPLSGWLCESSYGWPSVFYLCGALGVVWFVLWICLVHSSPSTHPRISRVELDFIEGTLRNETAGKDSTAPLLSQETPVGMTICLSLDASLRCLVLNFPPGRRVR
jgi:MFS family permease